MKKIIFTIASLFILPIVGYSQTTHNVNVSGITFSPSELTITVGDTVKWNGTANHPVKEVNQDTYNNKGITSNGGFDFTSGSGKHKFTSTGTYYYVCANHAGSGMIGKVTVQNATNNTTAVENAIELINLKVYPNPSSDFLNIHLKNKLTGKWEVKVTPTSGGESKVILSEAITTTGDIFATLHIASLASGVYTIEVISPDGSYTSKFIKQ